MNAKTAKDFVWSAKPNFANVISGQINLYA
jgi:hypothetical protein